MKKLLWFVLIAAIFFTACVANNSSVTQEITLPPTSPPTSAPSAAPTDTATVAPTAAPTDTPAPELGQPVGAFAHDVIASLTEGIGPRVAGSPEEAAAAQLIAATFQSLGYSTEEQVFSGYNPRQDIEITSANVIAIKTGQSDEIVIIGAHYDSPEVGKGADDNASGVGVMLEVADMLKDVELPYTVYFIAFGAEELGTVGSDYFVEQMTDEEIANTILMINLDSLLAGDIAYVYGDEGEGGAIRDWLLGWAEEEGLPLQTQMGQNPSFPYGTTCDCSDFVAFKEVGIPYVYFEATNWLLGKRDGYTQVDQEYGVNGYIWHTPYDHLEYIESTFPGRIEEHLELFVSALYEICIEYPIPELAQ